MYINYWKNAFDYKGTSSLISLMWCIMINIAVLVLIMVSGLFVPITWENTVVDIYYLVLLIMIIPTVSMVVRVVHSFIEN
ncbi:hypothetical protein [Staphylococcus succinus]|uniref:DUF2798 domain-containing protein n=2 Tax=Staphylococcus succinus TaxID=61015 RepID=A0ABX5IPQ5_9STAP|nr:hypothetical protein [Staphylococcus succinus]PTI69689.1 hypothetical protein BU057_04280 [Staphylococcus succinus]RIN24270.1 hypothetical protein BU067_10435 [Staphylococcus succinus]RIN38537.1 hypothetical protein BU059_13600 [Staphylococcus succinus]RIN40859.1 hypothetical protein BU061_00320 [Staphylococcus succinus]